MDGLFRIPSCTLLRSTRQFAHKTASLALSISLAQKQLKTLIYSCRTRYYRCRFVL